MPKRALLAIVAVIASIGIVSLPAPSVPVSAQEPATRIVSLYSEWNLVSWTGAETDFLTAIAPHR